MHLFLIVKTPYIFVRQQNKLDVLSDVGFCTCRNCNSQCAVITLTKREREREIETLAKRLGSKENNTYSFYFLLFQNKMRKQVISSFYYEPFSVWYTYYTVNVNKWRYRVYKCIYYTSVIYI